MNPVLPVQAHASRHFDAPPERVYNAFLDVDIAQRFMFRTPEGQMVRAEVNPVEGGTFVFVERRGVDNAEHYGTFVELDRPRRIVFTFAVEKDVVEPDHVTIEVLPHEGGCEVHITHDMKAEWVAYVTRTEEGWTGILEGLSNVLDDTEVNSPW